VTGFRVGNFAYISDIKTYHASIFDDLRGVEKLVISAPRKETSFSHLSLAEALSFARKVGAQETRITHISHALDHEETNRELPSDIQLAHDGLILEFTP
jgi:phosphoribosyl 1,2-cyclic phosphate phosphodiesterase